MRFRLENAPILDYFGLKLGETRNGMVFQFPVDLLSQHLMISGQTGTGKTRMAMNLAVKAENHESVHPIKILVIDVEGEWKKIIPMMKKPTQYFSVNKNLRINPFDLEDPALIRELMRETVFKGIEKEYVDLSAQMNFVLRDAIANSKNMSELINNIKTYDKEKLTALQKTKTALLVRLDPFLRSPLKEIFFCKKSNPNFNTLDEHNVFIDLHELDKLVAYSSELRLIYNTITTYFLRKMLNKEPTNSVSNLVFLEEGQLLVPKILHKMIVTESWPATEFSTRLRKRGCGMVVVTQSPSNIEKDIFKNTATKFSFRLQHQEDIKLIADSCGFIDFAEVQYLSNHFVNLPRKDAIVSTSGFEPFLITSDEFETEEHDIPLEENIPVSFVNEENQDESLFIESIKSNPFLSVRERRKSLGWNDKRYYQTVTSLVHKKKVEIQKAKLGRGAPILLYQVPGTIPSVKHEFYVNWIKNNLKLSDIKTNIKEGPDIEIPSLKTVLEIELGKSDIKGNIRRNLQKYNTVIVCSDQKKLLQALSNENKNQNVLFLPIQNVPASVEKIQAGNRLVNNR